MYREYYIPKIKLTTDMIPIGHYGRLRKKFLLEHRPVLWNRLILSEKLWDHLHETDVQANERLHRLTEQMSHAEGVNEELKSSDQMEWIRQMNNIRNRAEEIVLQEIVYC